MPNPSGVTDILGLGRAGEKGLEIAGKFLERIFGPAADALGDAMASPIQDWHRRRVQRAGQIVRDAAEIVAGLGHEPHPVPGRVLWPILEKGSLEETPELQQRWT